MRPHFLCFCLTHFQCVGDFGGRCSRGWRLPSHGSQVHIPRHSEHGSQLLLMYLFIYLVCFFPCHIWPVFGGSVLLESVAHVVHGKAPPGFSSLLVMCSSDMLCGHRTTTWWHLQEPGATQGMDLLFDTKERPPQGGKQPGCTNRKTRQVFEAKH